MRDNLETLYGAIEDGALAIKLPKHARKELEAYLDCGLLCRGFARLSCGSCGESRLVAFSCKGRGFCPSCMGRRMCQTAANLIERTLPPIDLRQRYEARHAGLGRAFVAAIDAALVAIASEPEAWPAWERRARFRRYVVQRFPYVVF